MYLRGFCRICQQSGESIKKALIVFPFGSPSHRYLPKYYEVCKKCAKTSSFFDQLPHPAIPEYGEYNFFVHYNCQCCGPDHALSIEEVETFIGTAVKCAVREVSVDMGYCEKYYPSVDELVKDLPKRFIPNVKWRERELELINDKKRRLKKRKKEVESYKLHEN